MKNEKVLELIAEGQGQFEEISVCPHCNEPSEERFSGDEGWTFCTGECGCIEGEGSIHKFLCKKCEQICDEEKCNCQIKEQQIPTRMFCQICGHIHKIDYWVPDEIWYEAIHPRYNNSLVCLNCFMERADERLLNWEKEIKLWPCSMFTQIEIQKSVGAINSKTSAQ